MFHQNQAKITPYSESEEILSKSSEVIFKKYTLWGGFAHQLFLNEPTGSKN